jgi:hypothetical protein
VATLSSPGGVVSGGGVGVGDASGIGPQPVSNAKSVTTTIIDGTLVVVVMLSSTAARSRGRFNAHLPGKGNRPSDTD